MLSMVERISSGSGATRQQLREETARAEKRGRPRHFAFNYRPPTKAFTLQLRFRKADVPKDELIRTLESILDDLRRPDSASHNSKAKVAAE
jgi:hypothetical protein